MPALRAFFAELQVPIASVTDVPISAREILENSYKDNESFRLIDDVYFLGMVDDAAFKGGKSLAIDKIKSDYDGILIFGITLRGRDDGLLPKLRIGMRVDILNYLKLKKLTCVNLTPLFEHGFNGLHRWHGFLGLE